MRASLRLAVLMTSLVAICFGERKSMSTSSRPPGAFQSCMNPMMPGEACQPAGGLNVMLSAGLLVNPQPPAVRSTANASATEMDRDIERPPAANDRARDLL